MWMLKTAILSINSKPFENSFITPLLHNVTFVQCNVITESLEGQTVRVRVMIVNIALVNKTEHKALVRRYFYLHFS